MYMIFMTRINHNGINTRLMTIPMLSVMLLDVTTSIIMSNGIGLRRIGIVRIPLCINIGICNDTIYRKCMVCINTRLKNVL